jgi:predicted membrane protein
VTARTAGPTAPPSRPHLPSLAAALTIMVVGTLYPPLMFDPFGRPDHWLAVALFWAMSAGFVRGVGFVPRHSTLRRLYSGWSCAIALGAALALKLGLPFGA